MLKVAGGEQVMLKVRIAEMDRNIAKQFGINLPAPRWSAACRSSHRPANPFGLLGQRAERSVRRPGRPGLRPSPAAAVGNPQSYRRFSAGSLPLHPLQGPQQCPGRAEGAGQVGLVHMLAEPNLTAVSGETAQVPRRRRIPGSRRPRQAGQRLARVQAVRRRPVLHAGGAGARPHLAADFHRGQRTHQHRRLHAAGRHRHRQRRHHHHAGPHHSGADGAPRRRPRSNCPPAAASPSPA